MFNAGPHGAEFSLPPLPLGFLWHLAIDTSRSAPRDLSAAGEETLVDNSTYQVGSRSSVILLARKQEAGLVGGSL